MLIIFNKIKVIKLYQKSLSKSGFFMKVILNKLVFRTTLSVITKISKCNVTHLTIYANDSLVLSTDNY